MPSASVAAIRAALSRYDDPLLRAIAAKLFKPRSHWPAEELIDRAVEALANTPVIDRRLNDLTPASGQLLTAIGLTRHSNWAVGQLLALLSGLGHNEGMAPVLAMLDAGLAVPELPPEGRPIRQWEDWLGATPTTARLFVPPAVAERAARGNTGLPQLPGKKFDPRSIHFTDGLEWLLRLGVAWQQLSAAPIRLTQSNALFKRDLTRLQADPLLGTAPTDVPIEVPEPGVLALQIGIAAELFVPEGGELRPGPFPPTWDAGLLAILAAQWSALAEVEHWDPERGYFLAEGGEPFSTVALTAMLLLAAQAGRNVDASVRRGSLFVSPTPVLGRDAG